jgi:TIR domain
MSSKHIFFSYSRDNSEFVLDLAKKLRAAGRNVWLDQLDIETGERWDRSIEKALEKADVLLVVLSKTSVDSNNVMDEVSFALEEGKRVLPVLYEDCDIPFRLRRLQFADFTTDVDSGMETLFRALDMDDDSTDEVKTSPTSTARATNEKSVREKDTTVSKPSESNEQDISKRSGSRRTLIIIIAVISIALGAWGISSIFTVSEDTAFASEDQEDWDAIIMNPDLVSLNEHIDLFAPCPHETLAMTMIDSLSKQSGGSGISDSNNSMDSRNDEGNNSEEEDISDPVDPEPVIVTGYNVTLVKYTNGEVDPAGQFKLVDTKVWEEESFTNNSNYKFTEEARDEWSVYLYDESRELKIQLDLYTNKVNVDYDSPDWGTLYNITSSSAKSN